MQPAFHFVGQHLGDEPGKIVGKLLRTSKLATVISVQVGREKL
ncbi:hypothetical protein [Rhodococcus qingshengii]